MKEWEPSGLIQPCPATQACGETLRLISGLTDGYLILHGEFHDSGETGEKTLQETAGGSVHGPPTIYHAQVASSGLGATVAQVLQELSANQSVCGCGQNGLGQLLPMCPPCPIRPGV